MSEAARSTAPPTPIYILRGSESPVTALQFADDVNDGSLLSGCQNGNVHLWDLTTRRSRHCFDAHQGSCVLFVTSAQSDTLMTQGRDGYFKTWKCSGPQYVLEGTLDADMDGFCSAALLPQENSMLVALPGQASTVQLTDPRSRSRVRTLNPGSRSDAMGLCLCLSALSNQAGISAKLAAGYESGKMVLWDVGSGKLLDTCTLHEDAVMCACFGSARLNKGLAGSVSETLVAWTVSDKDQIKTVSEVKCTNPGFNAVTIRPDDRIAAAAGWDKQVRIFNMKSMRPLAVLPYHRESVRCVRFSKDHLLAVGSNDHLISLWDIYRK